MAYLYVFLGGGLGCVLRYAISGISIRLLNHSFPYATLAVNVAGAFMLGLLFAAFQTKNNYSSVIHPFFVAGLLGGFTTFSAFSLETLLMIKNQQPLMAFANIGANVLLCLIAATLGIFFAKYFSA